MEESDLPLANTRVIEFPHMVMGPSVGLILGDRGADVIKVEPLDGDETLRLLSSGFGYFPMFNRNKRSICLNLKAPEGIELARRLVGDADVMIENFRPGTLERPGLEVTIPDGEVTLLPALPLELNGERLSLRHDIPQANEHGDKTLRKIGLGDNEIRALRASGIAG